MHSTNQAFGHFQGRQLPRAAGLVVGLGLLLGGAATAQARPIERPVWPVGKCVDGKLTAGEGFHILQGYNVDNDFVGRCAPTTVEGGLGLACKHGGVDIREDGDTTTLSQGEPVMAMANGEVLDVVSWGAEGAGVLVEHEDGTVAHYVHLTTSYVDRGEMVRQGQPVGAIMDYPYGGNGNDHLHLELREPTLTVKTCPNSGDKANCDVDGDFHWECKGNGYALDAAGSTTVDANDYDFVDPGSALNTAVIPNIDELWTAPGDEPLIDLRFSYGESGSIQNYGSGGGSASGSVAVERPYPELPADFCDQAGRGSVSYEGSADTSFADGVVIDMDLKLDQITSGEYLDVARGGDDEHTIWRLAVRQNAETGRRELAFSVTLAPEEEGGEARVSEIVGELGEPQCRAAAVEAACLSGVSAPAACSIPESCDPSVVDLHCFSDLGYRQWHHVAAVYDDGAGTFQLLLDGDEIAGGVVGGELQGPEGTVTVYLGDGGAGLMDDVRVWDLSATETEKGDDLDTFGGVDRGATESGCACNTTGSGAGGSLLLLLGLWGLRRRRVA